MPAFIFLVWCCQSVKEPIPARKIEVLFLGHDSEHHHSEAYLPLLAAALTPQGINFTYTADPAQLRTETLQKYDALLIYANHDEITKEQERALLRFVKKGGGFIPVHSASYCFRNSEAYVRLVGAQFKSHETGTFKAEIIDPDHPAMAGLEAFETWDETYVHTLHNEDRTVLMERIEGERREPYTWVRSFGQGRVFYTALGHDERTWGHPGFHKLIRNGILWAVGDQKRAAVGALNFPELRYSAARIPNYEKRDPPPKLQAPLSVTESQQLIQVPPDFDLQLFASEPDIVNPISMAWDEKGRLFVIETRDYPNEIDTLPGVGSDVIKIVEDTDQDGRADKFTVFADRLSVPTSLVFYQGGLIVSQAPYFLFLKDTDGDDKADVREVIMEGWGTHDTHAGPSNLRYGFDNHIWGVLGYSGFKGTVGGEYHEFSQGIYRFLPDGSALEFMSATTNNTWGLGFSETFDVFVSTANNTHSGYMGIPRRYLRKVEGLNLRGVKKIDGHYAIHPVTRNFRQVDVFGGFTAAAGHNLYTARNFPPEYWNRIAFVCEPTGHLLHNAILEKTGAGFAEKDGWNILASVDEWVSPVYAGVGPDGALWIIDWYNFIIQHNPTPTGFETGKGNAHINPLRDRQRGRIYRLVYKKARKYPAILLDKDDPEQLVQTLKNDNMLWRMHAQRLLVERDRPDIADDLLALVEDGSVDEIGLNSPAVHALWTLHGLGMTNSSNPKVLEVVRKALQHPAAGVRKAAIQVLPKNETTLNQLLLGKCLNDPDAHTRLAVILALADMPPLDTIGSLLYQLSRERSVREDEWLSRGVYAAAVKHKNSFIRAIYENDPAIVDRRQELVSGPVDWQKPELDISGWGDIPVPLRWRATKLRELDQFDGVVWFRREIILDETKAVMEAKLSLGPIDDTDDTYINGIRVGGLSREWEEPRLYSVPPGVLKAGRNVLAVRVLDSRGRGGIYGDPSDVFLQTGSKKTPLAGNWKFKIERVIRSTRSAFENGVTIVDLFLKHYGPFARQFAQQKEAEQYPVDRRVDIGTIVGQLKYDVENFTVTAGEILEIVFTNNDGMQHNILIAAPGSLELVGAAADKLALSPQGPGLEYIPQISQVLVAGRLVNPGEVYRLRFKVPDEPGDYPFICTFPAHWRTMNGSMKVNKPLK